MFWKRVKLNETLKTKKRKKRNINVRNMDHYAEAKIVMDLEPDKLDKATVQLENTTNDMKRFLEKIKPNSITKNYSLTQKKGCY